MEPGVGRIDFINTAPIYLGIDAGRVACPGRTVAAPPSVLNRLLREGEIQISAISSIAYAQAFPDWILLPDLSISARGPVKSVLLCLREPIETMDRGSRPRVGLTDKSGTSKALTRIFLEDRHHLIPEYEDIDLTQGVPERLDGMLVIGDDALKLNYREAYPHALDLGSFWVDWTGLPFVFGLWAVDRKYSEKHPEETEAVVEALIESKEIGIRELTTAAHHAAGRTGVPEEVCQDYLRHIEYGLDEKHIEGLERFFSLLKERGEIDSQVEPVFWSNERREGIHGA